MARRHATALALALITAGCGDSDERAATAAEPAPARRPPAVVVDCSSRSMADFPDAFANPDNVVAGPLVIAGGAHTPADTIREYGGDKIPVLVAPGHRVTLELTRRAQRVAALAYGPLPQGVIRHADGHRAVTFEACRHDQESGTTAGGVEVTFWMGFVLAREPACVPLHVWVDDEPAPRRVVLRMGVRRCE